MTRRAAFAAAALILATAAILVAVVGTRSRPARGHHRGAAHDGDAVRVARTRLGRILVDARGHAFYLFLRDRDGRSRCGPGCARVWTPATVSGSIRSGRGVIRSKLTTTRRADGRPQLVYGSHPLYTLVADRRPGQIQGEGFLRSWYVVSPAGHQVGGRGGSSPPTY